VPEGNVVPRFHKLLLAWLRRVQLGRGRKLAIKLAARQLRQLRHVGRNPPRLVPCERVTNLPARLLELAL
jgi:hypothetical protein